MQFSTVSQSHVSTWRVAGPKTTVQGAQKDPSQGGQHLRLSMPMGAASAPMRQAAFKHATFPALTRIASVRRLKNRTKMASHSPPTGIKIPAAVTGASGSVNKLGKNKDCEKSLARPTWCQREGSAKDSLRGPRRGRDPLSPPLENPLTRCFRVAFEAVKTPI
jgi:hypothetical protein